MRDMIFHFCPLVFAVTDQRFGAFYSASHQPSTGPRRAGTSCNANDANRVESDDRVLIKGGTGCGAQHFRDNCICQCNADIPSRFFSSTFPSCRSKQNCKNDRGPKKRTQWEESSLIVEHEPSKDQGWEKPLWNHEPSGSRQIGGPMSPPHSVLL